MSDPRDPTSDLTIDCGTCIAANTTACSGCLVTHLLANDAGPIDYVPVPLVEPPPSDTERVIALFLRAGLVDDPPTFVDAAELDADSALPARPGR